MRLNFTASSFSLIAIAAVLAMSATANAGCTPSVTSDSYLSTCIGTGALDSNTGLYNTAVGSDSLKTNVNGISNTSIGVYAMRDNSSGSSNTGMGYATLLRNTSGYSNTAVGQSALESNTTGGENVALGYLALLKNTRGLGNTAGGTYALQENTTGRFNTALGYQAGLNWTTGAKNVAIGAGAGKNQTTGSNNIAIGAVGAATDTAVIRIGTKGTQTKAFMAGIRGVNVTGGQAVLVDANGQLGVASSSARYKQDIQPMGDASNRLLELRPVTFHYRQAEEDGSRPLQYGLIAEDVAAVMPELAVYNEDGSPESVAYQVLPSLLLNEYQKQNRKLEATEAKLEATQDELAEAKVQFEATEAKLEAVESELATIKLMLSKLALVQGSQTQLAAAP